MRGCDLDTRGSDRAYSMAVVTAVPHLQVLPAKRLSACKKGFSYFVLINWRFCCCGICSLTILASDLVPRMKVRVSIARGVFI